MNPANVRAARPVVEIIKGKNPAGERLEQAHPTRLAIIFLAVFLDRESDVFGAEFLAGSEWAARAAAQLANDVAEMFLNDRLTQVFVGKIVVVQKIIVEEMAERTVTDVVQQPNHAHVLFNIGRRRTLVTEHFVQGWIEMHGEFAGKMHGA